MRLYIESRGAIQSIQSATAIASRISIDMIHNPEKCWLELKRHRQNVRNAIARFEATEHMPCGYQDAAGDNLEYACRTFNDYLNAMIICKGRVPNQLQLAWQRWTGKIAD